MGIGRERCEGLGGEFILNRQDGHIACRQASGRRYDFKAKRGLAVANGACINVRCRERDRDQAPFDTFDDLAVRFG